MTLIKNRFANIEINKFTIINMVLLTYVFFLAASTTNSRYPIIMAIFFALITIILFPFYRCISFFKSPIFICIIIFIILNALWGFFYSGSMYTMKQILSYLIIFSPIMIFYYIRDVLPPKNRKLFLIGLFLILNYYFIKAFILYAFYGIDARLIASHEDNYGALSIGGGYPLAYSAAITGVCVLECLRIFKNKEKKLIILLIVTFISSVLVIFFTRSTITLIAFVVGSVIVILTPKILFGKTISKRILQILICITISIVSVIFANFILEFIDFISSSIGGIMGKRLSNFGDLISNEGDATYSVNRLSIPWESFKVFLKNPIFGICSKCGIEYYTKIANGAGGHCEWIDAFTCYGILGGIPLIYICFRPIKNTTYTLGLITTLILLGVFNPFISQVSCMSLFLFIPLLMSNAELFDKSNDTFAVNYGG